MHIKDHKLSVVQQLGSFVAKSTDMLYKETILVFFLSYLFVLGNCQPSVACPAKNSQQPVACAAPAERQQIVSPKTTI